MILELTLNKLNEIIEQQAKQFKALEEENEKLQKALERIMNEKGDYWYDKMIKVAKEALEK